MNSSSTNQNQNQNHQNQNNQNRNQGQNQNKNQNNSNNQGNQNNQNKTNRGEMNDSDKRFWTIIAAVIIVGGLIVLGIHQSANAPATSTGTDSMTEATSSTSTSTDSMMAMADASTTASTQTYTYSCDANKSISATFHLPKDDFANVNLSGGQHLILAHAVSADGARYANANESIVFWTKGVTAFVQENGTTTYSGCIANRFP